MVRASKFAVPLLVDDVLHHRQDADFRAREANPVERGYVNVSHEWTGAVRHVAQVRPFGDDPVEMVQVSFE